jgi:hypothetical protein
MLDIIERGSLNLYPCFLTFGKHTRLRHAARKNVKIMKEKNESDTIIECKKCGEMNYLTPHWNSCMKAFKHLNTPY